MARSKHIYMVVEGTEGYKTWFLYGLYTVKHEAIDCMKKLLKLEMSTNQAGLRLMKTRDGHLYEPELVLTYKQLKEEMDGN